MGATDQTVIPCMAHLDFLQFSQFLDCRIRFGLDVSRFAVQEFLDALDSGQALEELFAAKSHYCYIEGRAAGANFPDRELLGLDNADIARSVYISTSAIQCGLINNLDEAEHLMRRWPWQDLVALRDAAIRNGLQGEYNGRDVATFCAEVLDIAGKGLDRSEAWMLAYPEHVLRTGQNGADRALATYERLSGTPSERLTRLVQERELRLS